MSILTGADFNGSNFPQWVTEDTLSKILKEIKSRDEDDDYYTRYLLKLLRIVVDGKGGASGTGGQPNVSKTAKDKLENALKDLEDDLENTSDNLGDFNDNTKDVAKKQKRRAKNLNTVRKKTLEISGGILGFAATLIGKAVGLAYNNMDAYSKIYRQGALLQQDYWRKNKKGEWYKADGMSIITEIAVNMGLSLQKIAPIVEKNSQAIHKIGIQRFAKDVGVLSDLSGQEGEALKNYGYSVEETATFFADYIERARKVGDYEHFSDKQIRENARQSAILQSRWSQILGISTEKLRENMNAMFEREEIKNLLYSINDPEVKRKVKAGLQNVESALPKDIADLVTRLAATEIPEADPELNALLNAASPEFRHALLNLSKLLREGDLADPDLMIKQTEIVINAARKVGRHNLNYYEKNDAGRKVMKMLNDLEEKQGNYVLGLKDLTDAAMGSRTSLYNELDEKVANEEKLAGYALRRAESIDNITKKIKIANDALKGMEPVLGPALETIVKFGLKGSLIGMKAIANGITYLIKTWNESDGFFSFVGTVISDTFMGIIKLIGKALRAAFPNENEIKRQQFREKNRRGVEKFSKLTKKEKMKSGGGLQFRIKSDFHTTLEKFEEIIGKKFNKREKSRLKDITAEMIRDQKKGVDMYNQYIGNLLKERGMSKDIVATMASEDLKETLVIISDYQKALTSDDKLNKVEEKPVKQIKEPKKQKANKKIQSKNNKTDSASVPNEKSINSNKDISSKNAQLASNLTTTLEVLKSTVKDYNTNIKQAKRNIERVSG